MAWVWFRLSSFGRRGLSHCVGVPIGKALAWSRIFSFCLRLLRHCGGRPIGKGVRVCPASVLLVSVVSVTVVAGRLPSALFSSHLCYFGRYVLIHCFGGTIGKGICLVSPLFFWSACLSHCGVGPIGKGVGLVAPLFLSSAWAHPLTCVVLPRVCMS